MEKTDERSPDDTDAGKITNVYQEITKLGSRPASRMDTTSSPLKFDTGIIICKNICVVDENVSTLDVFHWNPDQVSYYLNEIWGYEWSEKEQQWKI